MSDPLPDSDFGGVAETDLPLIGFSLVVILCIYLAFRALKEYSTENKLKSAMYDETGVTSSYEYNLPTDEKVRLLTLLVYFLLGQVPSNESLFDVFESKRESTCARCETGDITR